MIKTWEMTRDKLNEELKTADKSGPDAKCSRYIQAQERLERINIMIEDWEDRSESIASVGLASRTIL